MSEASRSRTIGPCAVSDNPLQKPPGNFFGVSSLRRSGPPEAQSCVGVQTTAGRFAGNGCAVAIGGDPRGLGRRFEHRLPSDPGSERACKRPSPGTQIMLKIQFPRLDRAKGEPCAGRSTPNCTALLKYGNGRSQSPLGNAQRRRHGCPDLRRSRLGMVGRADGAERAKRQTVGHDVPSRCGGTGNGALSRPAGSEN